METQTKLLEKQTGKHNTISLSTWLAYLYAPILPHLKNLKIVREGSRKFNTDDILLPKGYVAEVVATGFSAPVHCCFDTEGRCYIFESGHKTSWPPRIMKVDVNTGEYETFYEVPEARWNQTGALTGGCWIGDYLYFMNTDRLSRIGPEGNVEDILTGLPGRGDHQSNYPIVGPEGKIYYGQGCATNAGVVGADNFAYEWLPKFPNFHDFPAQDLVLNGLNFEFRNVLGSVLDKVKSGAYMPFGVETHPGQQIPGTDRPTGAIMRCDADGSNLKVVAWGLRNPYGIGFGPDGILYCTEHGMDERGARYIVGDPDDFYRIEEGQWYGWPDYASGIRLDDPHWGEGGKNREPLIQNPPNSDPPKPVVSFQEHLAANGFDICRDPSFGFEGNAFVAGFGDLAPITTVMQGTTPSGFKVVRVDIRDHKVYDFAVNRIEGPASKLPHAGFERPSHCQFGPDGALYVVDYGEIDLAPEKGGIRQKMGTGALWRIRRASEPREELPPKPLVIPLYLFQGLGILAAVAVSVAGMGMLLRWLRRR